MKINFPYNRGHLTAHLADQNVKAVLTSGMDEYEPSLTQLELMEEALANPIDSKKLSTLARNKNKVLLVTSDHTRALPSKLSLPLLLGEIRTGNPKAEITIMVATGLHRPSTREELINMFGKTIVEEETIVFHRAEESENMVFLDTLPSGNELWINRMAVETDLLVCEGFIEPHFFAGFSGGRKSILPGICGEETIRANHSARAIGHPLARTGILDGNPIHEDMIFAARKAGVDFILNVAQNGKKEVIAAFAGDIDAAHRRGCEFVKKLSGADRVMSEITITSNGGYPLDQNLYQSPKAISTAAECTMEGGTIIIVASCCNGVGGTEFEREMMKGTPRESLEAIHKLADTETVMEQWCIQILSGILLKFRLILVTDLLDHEIIKKMNIIPASNIDDAVEKAFELEGRDASVTVIPDGVAVMVQDD